MIYKEKYNLWKSYKFRRNYCTFSKRPFYDIAAKYLPSDENGIIVDIGAGEGKFADYLALAEKYNNVFLLDGNNTTVEKLKKKFENAVLYKAPGSLPFEDLTVSYVHCSHLIEHLMPQELYELLREIDRVLSKDGVLVISAPMLWGDFYSNLTHIKPYNPGVFLKYLCGIIEDPSAGVISDSYSVLELVYRYAKTDLDEGWGSRFFVIDFIIQLTKLLLSILRIKRYTKNGYTMVLKKGWLFDSDKFY
ncbi:hypothetical protein AMJ80_12540 [bacterium SM23_31]|nr:MAG: hypothetical protein AMJ80_12540 [bacterium SM23_31]